MEHTEIHIQFLANLSVETAKSQYTDLPVSYHGLQLPVQTRQLSSRIQLFCRVSDDLECLSASFGAVRTRWDQGVQRFPRTEYYASFPCFRGDARGSGGLVCLESRGDIFIRMYQHVAVDN